MKKNIYFVQVGFEFDGSVYLPYAAGTMIANCKQNPDIEKAYAFPNIIFKREKLDDALIKLKEPYMVAFSCSVWNCEYNKALAKKVKAAYPDCITVFGGHSVSRDAKLLEEEYIDILMFGEGERTFASLLINLAENSIDRTFDIAYKADDGIKSTDVQPVGSLDELPSPYLTGVFDKIVSDNREMEFLGVLETNRGCPYSCAYCDWCAGKKMRFFPMEKVLSEIRWLSENKIAYCFCADSNFGMFERDVEIAHALIKAKKENGYPEVFRPCYEKNSADRVFEICSALNSVGMDKGATMAYQTLCDDALTNIGRKNLTMEHFSSLMKKYNEAGIPTYSELILGLPGETRESFCKGICRLLENGQHNSLSVYHCEALPNSELTEPEYIKKHGIEVIKVAFNHIHSAPDKNEEVKEYSYLVRSTNTLSREDWVYANLFSVCVQCFHSLGILRFLAMYLHNEGKTDYFSFYSGLLDFILKGNGTLSKLWNGFRQKYETSLAGDWNYYNKDFGNVTWFFDEGSFIEIINNYDEIIKELDEFISGFGLSKDFVNELSDYQKLILRKPFDEETTLHFSYDFRSFFDSVTKGKKASLEKRDITVKVSPSIKYESIQDYAKETVWFGRRRGATLYSSKEIEVVY